MRIENLGWDISWDMEWVTTLVSFEGELVSVYQNLNDQSLWVVCWVDYDAGAMHDVWHTYLTNRPYLQDFVEKKLSLRQLVEKSPEIYLTTQHPSIASVAHQIDFEKIQEDRLPTDKSFFDEELLADQDHTTEAVLKKLEELWNDTDHNLS